MKKYEYQLIILDLKEKFRTVDLDEMNNELNMLSQSGWELVEILEMNAYGFTHCVIYSFKKEIKLN